MNITSGRVEVAAWILAVVGVIVGLTTTSALSEIAGILVAVCIMVGLGLRIRAFLRRPGEIPRQTAGLFNGQWWKVVSHEIQVGYVAACCETHLLWADALRKHPGAERYWFDTPPGYGHVIGALDDFYKDPANLPIPVSAAIWVVAMKLNGESQQDIGNVIVDLRKRVEGGQFLQRL